MHINTVIFKGHSLPHILMERVILCTVCVIVCELVQLQLLSYMNSTLQVLSYQTQKIDHMYHSLIRLFQSQSLYLSCSTRTYTSLLIVYNMSHFHLPHISYGYSCLIYIFSKIIKFQDTVKKHVCMYASSSTNQSIPLLTMCDLCEH